MNLILLILPVIGFLIGVFVTTIGGGGGGLYVPVLIMLGIEPRIAVATSLATVLPTTMVGSYNHYRRGHVDTKMGLTLGIGGFIGTFIGIYISSLIPQVILKKLFGILFLILVIPSLRNLIKELRSDTEIKKKRHVSLTGYKKIIVPLFGVVGGILSGIFGISGSPPIQIALLLLGYAATTVVGTTIFVLIFNSIGGIIGYSYLGRIDIPIVLLLCFGTIIGAVVGPKILEYIKERYLEIGIPIIIITLNIIFAVDMLFF